MVLAQVRPARVLVALAWVVLDQGQARVKVEDLDPVAVRDLTAMALAMEPAMAVLFRQMVQVMVQAMVPVRPAMDRAAAANNARLLGLLKGSPHPNPPPRCGGGWQGEGVSLTTAAPTVQIFQLGKAVKGAQQGFILHLHPRSIPCA